MLSVRQLQASYGAAQVLFDISLDVGAGEVVTLLGRNGMGKTTTIRSIMGLLRPRGGEVRFDGAAVDGPCALPDRADRHRPRAGGTADLSDADGGGESRRHRASTARARAAGRSMRSTTCFRA